MLATYLVQLDLIYEKVGGKYDAAEIENIIQKGRGAMSPGIIQGEDAKKVSEWLAEHK